VNPESGPLYPCLYGAFDGYKKGNVLANQTLSVCKKIAFIWIFLWETYLHNLAYNLKNQGPCYRWAGWGSSKAYHLISEQLFRWSPKTWNRSNFDEFHNYRSVLYLNLKKRDSVKNVEKPVKPSGFRLFTTENVDYLWKIKIR
jgi:hypothetical protein